MVSETTAQKGGEIHLLRPGLNPLKHFATDQH